MKKGNQDIQENPEFLEELINGKKIILSETIYLKNKPNNERWLIGKSNVQHQNAEEELVFMVGQSKLELKYGLKLRCPKYTQEPFFRFDSDGPAHRNHFDKIPLEEQSIPTPHFNTFDKSGRPYAYKNETLKKVKEVEAIVNDINFGISLFCMETNSFLKDGNFPNTEKENPEIDFEIEKGTNFDQISFE